MKLPLEQEAKILFVTRRSGSEGDSGVGGGRENAIRGQFRDICKRKESCRIKNGDLRPPSNGSRYSWVARASFYIREGIPCPFTATEIVSADYESPHDV